MTVTRDTSVAVLGTGIMASAMARNLLKAGLRTTVWDRSPSATAARAPRMKLVINACLAALVEGVAEALALAKRSARIQPSSTR